MPKGIYSKNQSGWKHSKETKQKMSEIRIGIIFPKETRIKLSKALMGNKNGLGSHRSEEHKRKISETHKGIKLTEEHKQKLSEAHKGKPSWNKGIKTGELSEEHKIKIGEANKGKKISERHKKKLSEIHKGEKNHNWQGGISFEPYSVDWTRTLKKSIRERDKYTCQICGKEPAVQVHHIDYNKLNCNPDNLITLCRNCHPKTNHNRDYWIKYFNSNEIQEIQNENNEINKIKEEDKIPIKKGK